MGEIGILNVGAGDTKLTFDPKNPAEMIRSGRIVTDMLRRGYALLVEVERKGVKAFERVKEFREDKCEYIIADFDPVAAEAADRAEAEEHGEAGRETAGETAEDTPAIQPRQRGRPGKTTSRAIPASGARAVAVARSAGG